MTTCTSCGKEVDEVCGDGFCRECHVDLSFEDCTSGTWAVDILTRGGTVHRPELEKLYPEAKQLQNPVG